MNTKSYSEMIGYSTFEDRFNYLKLQGTVGVNTFGFDRYLNQNFYKSKEWKTVRDYIIVRDGACDLGIEDRIIESNVYIHHINPLTPEDIEFGSSNLFDPENLICVSRETHEALHYGDERYLEKQKLVIRRPGDTCPWK